MTDAKSYEPGEDVLADLRGRFGDKVHVVRSGEHTLVIRKPGRADYKRFMSEAGDPNKRGDATENLVRGLLLWPDKPTFNAWLDDVPALPDDVADPILRLAGITGKAELAKS